MPSGLRWYPEMTPGGSLKGLSTGEKTALCRVYDLSHLSRAGQVLVIFIILVSGKHKQDRSVRVAECGAVTPKPGVPLTRLARFPKCISWAALRTQQVLVGKDQGLASTLESNNPRVESPLQLPFLVV